MAMKLGALLSALADAGVRGNTDAEVRDVVYDSRRVRPGSVFVALPGSHQDGWHFAADAAKRGAVAVVTECVTGGVEVPCIVRVPDARLALAQLACAFYENPGLHLRSVGITGTNGKTTVSYMCRSILRAAGENPGLIGTVEYQIGERSIPAMRTTPEAPDLQNMFAQMTCCGTRTAVMEVSSHSLVQQRVAGIDFDVAVFTNLTRDHLDYHRTMEEYFEAKAMLFESLGRNRPACAVINIDDPWGRKLVSRCAPGVTVLTYGLCPEADVRTSDVRLNDKGSRFHVHTPWGDQEAAIRLLGRYNISNFLAAVAVGGCLKVDLDTMVQALAQMPCVPGRLEEVPTGRDYQVFVDYAHTDDALAHVLTTLREVASARLLLVFGCGGDRDRTKRPIMGKVAGKLADLTFITSDNPRTEAPEAIIAEIVQGFGQNANFEAVVDRRDAIRAALREVRPGDILLIAGKGHEAFQEFAHTTVPFDDRQVVQQLLETEP